MFENNREATLGALRAGREGRPSVAEALAARDTPSNAYYNAVSTTVIPCRPSVSIS